MKIYHILIANLLACAPFYASGQQTPNLPPQSQLLMERDLGLRWAWKQPENPLFLNAVSKYYRNLMLSDWKSISTQIEPSLDKSVLDKLLALVQAAGRQDVKFIEVVNWKNIQFNGKPGILMISRMVSKTNDEIFNKYLWDIFYINSDQSVIVAPFDLITNPVISFK